MMQGLSSDTLSMQLNYGNKTDGCTDSWAAEFGRQTLLLLYTRILEQRRPL